jgi:signal transduction histidine kinase
VPVLRLVFLVIINCFFINLYLFSNDSYQEFFSLEEKEYIKSNPSVKIAMLNNFKPFSFVENGQHYGMSKDILDQIASFSGLEFTIELSRWTEALNKFKNKKVDMISGISHIKQRETFSLFSEPFYEIPTYLFGLKGDVEYTGQESLKNKRVGVSKSLFYIEELKKYGIKVVELNSSDEKVQKLVLGEIDYFLASYTSGTKAIKQAAITSIKPITEFTSIKKEDLRFGIDKDNPILFSIIRKSMLQITSKQYEQMVNKWIIDLDREDQLDNGKEKLFAKFSKKEIAYLRAKKSIRYCIHPHWMPYESYEDDIHQGISLEYKNIFEEKLAIPFRLVKTKSWEESKQFVKEGKCEILSFLTMKTADKTEYLRFTTPYLKVPFVIATKNNVSFIADFSLLNGKKIAMPKEYISDNTIQKLYPDLKIVYVENTKEGLEKVIKGDVFGLLGTLESVGYILQNNYLGELKIAGKFEYQWELAIASIKADPILSSILQKTLNSITISQRADIYNRWVSVKYEPKVDYKKIWEIVIFALSLLIIILYWNRKLDYLNKELKKQQKITKQALMVKSNFLANISHEIRTPMNSIVNMSYLAKELSTNKKQKGYIEKMESAANTLLQFINNVLDISKIDAGKTEIVKSKFFLDSITRNLESIISAKAMVNNIDFKIIIEKDVPNCLIGDSLRIEQVLINLTSNGIKFTCDGEVVLHISKIGEDQYQFCISDTGIGMNKEQITKIFEPFAQGDDTTTRNYGGTGLGLSISKELVILMGGKLWVTSKEKKGSRFYFTLPLKKFREKEQEKQVVDFIEYKNHNCKKENVKKEVTFFYEKELFEKLQKALEQKRPNMCKPLIDELEQYELKTIDEKRFLFIKNLVLQYKFEDALGVFYE